MRMEFLTTAPTETLLRLFAMSPSLFEEMEALRDPERRGVIAAYITALETAKGENETAMAAHGVDLDQRVARFLTRLDKHPAEATVLVVAHSGVLRLLLCHLLEIDIYHWRQLRTDLASLSIVETHPYGTALNLLNDTSHLR